MLKELFRKGNVATAAVAALLALWTIAAAAQKPSEPLWDTGTFSILGYDPDSGEVGGAVQSRVFSAGNGVLWADASVGIAATQAIVDVSYGAKALAFLRQEVAPADVIKRVLDQDPDPLPEQWTKQGRQFAVMNLKGEYAAYTDRKPRSGPATRGASTAPRRETSSPGRKSSTTWSRASRRPLATYHSGWLLRSRAVRPAAATNVDSSRPRSSS